MAVKLHASGLAQARSLLHKRKFVADDRDAWSEHQPSASEENEFIRRHGMSEYGRWHLGVDDEKVENTKGHYKFPYGDFAKVHRCALLAAESRAGRYQYLDIEKAAHQLHRLMEVRQSSGSAARGTPPRPRSAAR
jgi:hypothetical protein